MAATATLYYDFNSPYAYMATERVDELIPGVEWKPFAYPFVLGHIGKLEDVLARDPDAVLAIASPRAEERGLPPLKAPPGWHTQTWSLTPLRAALFAEERGRLKEFTGAAFRTMFGGSRSLTELDNVLAAAGEAGLDPDEVNEAIQRPEIKQRLKDNTDEALARGVSGIPTVVVGDQVFWGDDRLEEAAAAAN